MRGERGEGEVAGEGVSRGAAVCIFERAHSTYKMTDMILIDMATTETETETGVEATTASVERGTMTGVFIGLPAAKEKEKEVVLEVVQSVQMKGMG